MSWKLLTLNGVNPKSCVFAFVGHMVLTVKHPASWRCSRFSNNMDHFLDLNILTNCRHSRSTHSSLPPHSDATRGSGACVCMDIGFPIEFSGPRL